MIPRIGGVFFRGDAEQFAGELLTQVTLLSRTTDAPRCLGGFGQVLTTPQLALDVAIHSSLSNAAISGKSSARRRAPLALHKAARRWAEKQLSRVRPRRDLNAVSHTLMATSPARAPGNAVRHG